MTAWQPTASLEALRARSRLLAAIRAFFAEREVLEVDTPVLSRAANPDPHLASLCVSDPGLGGPRYLQTSPEFPMKRLLAAGSGPVYQICKVFRAGEAGARHNPEFTMLEWYRPGMGTDALMAEVEGLLQAVLRPFRSVPAARRLSYRRAFEESLEIDPLEAGVDVLRSRARDLGLAEGLEMEARDDWLDLLLSLHVSRALGDAPVFIHDYPASQAALARLGDRDPRVAQRFELFWGDLELANGFAELTDPREQRVRFERDNARRRVRAMPELPLDEALLGALEAGMPDCAGVALGVDRLLMVALGAESIDQVLAFSPERA